MTRKLFWEDAYQKEFDAKVIAVEGTKVVLDQTCFYANSGGQIADTGYISSVRVVDVNYDGDEIVHITETPANFKAGELVHGRIDWERRYNIMRLHTSAHIISAVLTKDLGNILFTGSQIYPDRARMDFNIPKLDDEIVKFIEEKANKVVRMNLPVTARIITKEELEANPNWKRLADASHYEKFKVLRVVEIKDLDVQLDGGTHVKSTGEVGEIKIVKRENKGRNNRRITIVVS
jgi:misacylated tRNA(Ala) deacylase